eukprot:CAMPEP_0169431652 /NCGR_PEP_ID=MMETSP1042-20121227/3062_1 /TAXON_ID=464988 /ORGANISM="Hemiselmis andersenii, Strain CCMP1180" /LENGTH=324 /DNA_ID=CAMNT_0009542079 /DNA_START=94 /DNA_END=1066 /DNA_ORIENTATION=-
MPSHSPRLSFFPLPALLLICLIFTASGAECPSGPYDASADPEMHAACTANYLPSHPDNTRNDSCAALTTAGGAVAALSSLYAATSGDRWINNKGWGRCVQDGDYCGWYGVRCEGGAVVEISLGTNNLQGTIPTLLLTSLPLLESLDLSNNVLSGYPLSMGGGRGCEPHGGLGAAQRQALNGEVPDVSGLRYLSTLRLANNQLTGAIPPLTASLHTIDLSMNAITGSITPSILSLPALSYLSLSHNALSGPLPAPPAAPLDSSPHPTKFLDVSHNMLSGSLPPSFFTTFTSLLTLKLNGNPLSGTLPSEVGSLWNISHLAPNDLP